MRNLIVSEKVGKLTVICPGLPDQHVEGGHIFSFNDAKPAARDYLNRLLKSGIVTAVTGQDWRNFKTLLRRYGRPVPKHVLDNSPDEPVAKPEPGNLAPPGKLTQDNEETDALIAAKADGAKAFTDGKKHKDVPEFGKDAKTDEEKAVAKGCANEWHEGFNEAEKAKAGAGN